MNTYNGIPITEIRLLAYGVIFTILLLGLTVAVTFWIHTCLSMRNPKEKQHIKRLRKKAETDDIAKKKLEKLDRRNKRRRKRNRSDIICDVVIWSIDVCLTIILLGWCVIPAWTDYVKKDYVVYTGEIKVYSQMKHSHIELDDGTTVWGKGDFDEDDTYGTVVYSRRTKQFLGGRD